MRELWAVWHETPDTYDAGTHGELAGLFIDKETAELVAASMEAMGQRVSWDDERVNPITDWYVTQEIVYP